MPSACPDCQAPWTVYDKVCDCGRLVHAEKLEQLRRGARIGKLANDADMALRALREAARLLPEGHAERAAVLEEIARIELTAAQGRSLMAGPRAEGAPEPESDAPPPPPKPSPIPKWLAPLGVVGVLIWKFKSVLALALSKGKFLLAGLTKGKSLLAMLSFFAIYWVAFGWWFALGFVVSIYLHELGHLAALWRRGLAGSAPMFVPFFGAYVRMKQPPRDAIENARISLGGPLWGLFAAVMFHVAYLVTGSGVAGAIAHVGAWLNVVNLIPVWMLDGKHVFGAMNRRQQFMMLAPALGAFVLTKELTTLALAGAVVYRLVRRDVASEEGDERGALGYAFVLIALAGVMALAPDLPAHARH